MPPRNSSSPTQATSWRITDAPFAYVMPSKFVWMDSVSGMSAVMGWVDGSWSCWYAQVFSLLQNVVQALVNRVPFTMQSTEANVAKVSLSQRSSHHRMVTRSPNHMCAISCSTVSARRSRAASVTFDRNTYASLKVMHPAFSMAPELNSGTITWSYLSNG